MAGGQIRWTVEQVLALAPDDSSRRAGGRLARPGPWAEAGAGHGAVWGACRGSDGTPYRAVVDLDGPAFRCGCPSRKVPCKHVLALLQLWAADKAAVPDVHEPPEWAGQWLDDRRRRAGRGTADAPAGRAGARRPADPNAARRRAERRAARIAAGATELERRLADLLRGGLARADRAGYAEWDEMAARMVDAQAPGLAARIRELGAIPGSGPGWPARLLSECSLLHLLSRGFLCLDDLPAPLAATVRARVGITTEAAELLADRETLVRDRWLIMAQFDAREGPLTARRVWLHGRRSQRPALLLSYGAGGKSPELSLPVGSILEADLAYYPGARPLRAALGERHGEPEPGFVPSGMAVADASAAYGAALADDPWLEGWPVVLSRVVPIPTDTTGDMPVDGHGAHWQVADAAGDAALPLAGAARESMWRLAAISGGAPVTVFGECGHRGFAPYTVWDGSATPVTLEAG